MLCENKFDASTQDGYNEKWGVVFNKTIINGKPHGEDHTNWHEGLNSGFYKGLSDAIDSIWNEKQMTAKSVEIRKKLVEYLKEELRCVYPDGHLILSGSSISKCGTVKSDMDLCYAVKTSDTPTDAYGLPIGRYIETDVNFYMIDRIHLALRGNPKIKDLETSRARVPLVKFKLDIKDVDTTEESEVFEFDINCNCVAGVYNAFLLGGLATYDERFPKLALILKQWGKKVQIVNPYVRFNSYLVVLLLVHYLQCGVNPPVLPNLMLLQPETFDGERNDPWNLTSEIDRSKLPDHENRMSVGALLCGFFRYFSKFDFKKYGILIKDASIIDKNHSNRFPGFLGSMIFVEEPYDGLTVSKNVKKQHDFDHIKHEFMIANYMLHAINSAGQLVSPNLEVLFSREVAENDKVATSEEEMLHYKSLYGY